MIVSLKWARIHFVVSKKHNTFATYDLKYIQNNFAKLK